MDTDDDDHSVNGLPCLCQHCIIKLDPDDYDTDDDTDDDQP